VPKTNKYEYRSRVAGLADTRYSIYEVDLGYAFVYYRQALRKFVLETALISF